MWQIQAHIVSARPSTVAALQACLLLPHTDLARRHFILRPQRPSALDWMGFIDKKGQGGFREIAWVQLRGITIGYCRASKKGRLWRGALTSHNMFETKSPTSL